MHQHNVSFHARSNDGRSGDYVALDLIKDGKILGTWMLAPEEATQLAKELVEILGGKLDHHDESCPAMIDKPRGACTCGSD